MSKTPRARQYSQDWMMDRQRDRAGSHRVTSWPRSLTKQQKHINSAATISDTLRIVQPGAELTMAYFTDVPGRWWGVIGVSYEAGF